jgi:propanediol dehydratase small subunit
MTPASKAPDRDASTPVGTEAVQRPIRTGSGRNLDELTIDALRADRLTAEDFRISREQLNEQAAAAEAGG